MLVPGEGAGKWAITGGHRFGLDPKILAYTRLDRVVRTDSSNRGVARERVLSLLLLDGHGVVQTRVWVEELVVPFALCGRWDQHIITGQYEGGRRSKHRPLTEACRAQGVGNNRVGSGRAWDAPP